jgi:hypothetical protein
MEISEDQAKIFLESRGYTVVKFDEINERINEDYNNTFTTSYEWLLFIIAFVICVILYRLYKIGIIIAKKK